MIFRHRLKDPDRLMRIGWLFLILASLWKYFVHSEVAFWGNFMDGVTGMLYGISMAGLLVGLRAKSRGRAGGQTEPCSRA